MSVLELGSLIVELIATERLKRTRARANVGNETLALYFSDGNDAHDFRSTMERAREGTVRNARFQGRV